MEDHIQTLVEMGFSKNQAETALQSSGNVLTKAIAYLFGEVDDKGSGTQMSPYVVESAPIDSYDSINISNPQDLPEFLSQYASAEAMEAPTLPDRYPDNDSYQDYDYNSYGIDENMNVDNDPGETDQYDAEGSEMDQYDADEDHLEPNIKTEGHLFPVVACSSRKYQFWASMVAILAQFTPFADHVLTTEPNSPFVSELQRIVYFIRNFHRSSRWYISADPLVSQLVAGGSSDEYSDEEAVLNAYEYMMQQQNLLRGVLESLVESVEEDITKELTVLEIDSDTRRNNLYHTLNELFWQKGFVKFGHIKYTQVAPVVTYQLIGESTSYSMPFELQETIYPEIYSARAEEAVGREVKQMHEAERSLQTVTRSLMDVNFFEGKKILSLLRQAGAELARINNERKFENGIEERETEQEEGKEKKIGGGCETLREKATEDLAQLARTIENARAAKVVHQNSLRKIALGDHLGSYDGIAQECNLQPYDLLGVICGESRYYVRQDIDTYVQLDERMLVSFDDVQEDVTRITRHGLHLVTLVYGQREGCATVEDLIEMDSKSDSGDENGGDIGMREHGGDIGMRANEIDMGDMRQNEIDMKKIAKDTKESDIDMKKSEIDMNESEIDMEEIQSTSTDQNIPLHTPTIATDSVAINAPSNLSKISPVQSLPGDSRISAPDSSMSTNSTHSEPESHLYSPGLSLHQSGPNAEFLQAKSATTQSHGSISQLVVDQFHADERSNSTLQ